MNTIEMLSRVTNVVTVSVEDEDDAEEAGDEEVRRDVGEATAKSLCCFHDRTQLTHKYNRGFGFSRPKPSSPPHSPTN